MYMKSFTLLKKKLFIRKEMISFELHRLDKKQGVNEENINLKNLLFSIFEFYFRDRSNVL